MIPVPRPAPWEALHFLPDPPGTVLDVGCNVGGALEYAHQLGATRLYGIELNTEAAETAKERLKRVPGTRIVQGSAESLPFPDQDVDVVTCCEVLEHVPEELRPRALSEFHRVLKPGGRLILTVPARGIFSSLDPANFRFRFPKLFQWASGKVGGRDRQQIYETHAKGVVWHHHFRFEELKSLLGSAFEIEKVRWRGCLIAPVGDWVLFPLYRRQSYDQWAGRAIRKLQKWEMSLQLGSSLAYNVLIVARKV